MRKVTLVLMVLAAGSVSAKMTPQQQTYFNLLKGKMLSTVDGVGKSGVRSGETTVGVGVKVTLPGMGEVSMPEISAKKALHLCSDGSYIRNTDDNAMGIKSSTRETGTWAIGKASSAGFALMLTKKGGKTAAASNVSFDGERTVMGDERWYRLKSSACK
jgi:hypothetical protein